MYSGDLPVPNSLIGGGRSTQSENRTVVAVSTRSQGKDHPENVEYGHAVDQQGADSHTSDVVAVDNSCSDHGLSQVQHCQNGKNSQSVESHSDSSAMCVGTNTSTLKLPIGSIDCSLEF